MKQMDDAVLYSETLQDLGVPDPLSGETPADEEMRIAAPKYSGPMQALKEIITQDWGRIPAAPTNKKKARTRHG